MASQTKKRKQILEDLDLSKSYSISQAVAHLKKLFFEKFDPSMDIAIKLGVDPKKSNQMVRGSLKLPHGTGKTLRVLVLCNADKEAEAKEAGADFVGLDEYLEKIAKGWYEVDVIIAVPSIMAKVGKLGRVLGPRNLMPNPKTGTVTNDVGKAVLDAKGGKVDFKIDKTAIIHNSLGKMSFDNQKLIENIKEFIIVVGKNKPSSSKGIYFKSIYISSTMSPGIQIDINSIEGI